ncbi:MAG: peptide-methionine (R)-S-oxide reductase, partial [Frankiaceae bacterium]
MAGARDTGAVTDRIAGDEAQWRAALSPARFAVMRQAATEPPFTGKYTDCDTPGHYRCGACGADLF